VRCHPLLSKVVVTAPIRRVPEEGTLGAKEHLKAHLINSQKEGGVRLHLCGFQAT
jgi:hypothetical protein